LANVVKLAENMESDRIKQLEEEQEKMLVKLQEQTEIIMEYRTQITYLEEECELRKKHHLDVQEQLEQSHEHAEALLAEVEELESHIISSKEGKEGENGEGRDGGSLKELMDLRVRVKELAEELHNAQTVPQLQINDLDTENKTLQARLKAEKLDASAKLAAKDETIEELRKKLQSSETAGDVQDLNAARQKLQEARDDATAVRKSLETTNQTVEELRTELDRLLQKNVDIGESNQRLDKSNRAMTAKVEALNKDILEWMDKAYKWKDKADLAQRKVEDLGGARDDTRSVSTVETYGSLLANQSMFLQAAMEKTSPKSRNSTWNIFRKGSNATEFAEKEEEESVNGVVIRTLQEQKDQLEDTISLLQAENDQIEEEHKEELAKLKIQLAKLESENAALKQPL
jgi:chromosome segregation ATPase